MEPNLEFEQEAAEAGRSPAFAETEAETLYVIEWRSRAGVAQGRGTKRLPLHEARDLAAELNRDYPEFEHWVLELAL